MQVPNETEFKAWLREQKDYHLDKFERNSAITCPIACFLKEFFNVKWLCAWPEYIEIYNEKSDDWLREGTPNWASDFIKLYDSGNITNAKLKQWAEEA